MRPTELLTLATEMIRARQPLLITGAPGQGKSDIVTRAAELAEADLILSHPAVSDPTDIKGMPWVVDGSATFLPFGELAQAIKATRPTVWFFDDLGQSSPAVQASCMQLFLARRVNNHVLPDCITFIAATNRRTDRAGVSGVLEPVKSRFCTIVELEANVDDWIKWAIDANVAPELIAFIRFRPDLLNKFEATADLTNSPVPRTWNHVNKLIGLTLPKSVLVTAVQGAVGAGAAVEFLSFLDMYRQLPNIDTILADGTKTKIPKEPSVLYAISSALAAKAKPENFDQVAVYMERMLKEGHGEFAVLCLRDSLQRTPALKTTATLGRLVSSELGSLIAGA